MFASRLSVSAGLLEVGGGVPAVPIGWKLLRSHSVSPEDSNRIHHKTYLSVHQENSSYVLHIRSLHWGDKYLAFSFSGGKKLNGT